VIGGIVIGGVFGDYRRMKTARVLTLCTVGVLSACHQDSGNSTQPQAAPHVQAPVTVKKGPSAEELTAGMVEAATQGKSQLPVKLKFGLKQRPMLGQPLDIDIAVMPQIDAGAADILVTGGDGLTVAPGSNQFDLAAVETGRVYRQIVKVTPALDGVLLLGLSITFKHDETTDSRAFSIPLIVDR
jgi:hypothetical protein